MRAKMDKATDGNIPVESKSGKNPTKLFAGLGVSLVLWAFLYFWLKPAADFITSSILGLSPLSHLGSSVNFFLYDAPKVLMLLVLVVFVIGIIRTFFTPERTRSLLAGKKNSSAISWLHPWELLHPFAPALLVRCL
jgi:uncharacterized protein